MRWVTRLAAYACLFALVGCPRSKGTAPVGGGAASPPGDAAIADAPDAGTIADATADASVDAGADPVPWITTNVDFPPEVPPRTGGHVVRPIIELPARTIPDADWSFRAAIEGSFPFIALRTRGLPAVSADGTRVAHVWGNWGCCRATGFTSFHLFIWDARTGATKQKLLLWDADDETRIPQRDQTGAQGTRFAPGVAREMTEEGFEKNLAAYEKLLRARVEKAMAFLVGDWTTLAELHAEEQGESESPPNLTGEDVELRLGGKAAFPPLVVKQKGATARTFPGERFRVPLRGCPAESMALYVARAFALRDRSFAVVETTQGIHAPDGCEGSGIQFLSWAK